MDHRTHPQARARLLDASHEGRRYRPPPTSRQGAPRLRAQAGPQSRVAQRCSPQPRRGQEPRHAINRRVELRGGRVLTAPVALAAFR